MLRLVNTTFVYITIIIIMSIVDMSMVESEWNEIFHFMAHRIKYILSLL